MERASGLQKELPASPGWRGREELLVEWSKSGRERAEKAKCAEPLLCAGNELGVSWVIFGCIGRSRHSEGQAME